MAQETVRVNDTPAYSLIELRRFVVERWHNRREAESVNVSTGLLVKDPAPGSELLAFLLGELTAYTTGSADPVVELSNAVALLDRILEDTFRLRQAVKREVEATKG